MRFFKKFRFKVYQRCTESEIFPPTPHLLWQNILRVHSDAVLSFGLRILLELQSECYKLLARSQRPYPVFAVKRLKNRLKRNC